MNNTDSFKLVILGGSSAIGVAYARKMVAQHQGCQIILVGRDQDKLSANKADLIARGGNVETVIADLTDLSVASKILSQHDHIDQFLIVYGVLTDQTLAQQEDEYLERQMDTNFVSAARWLEVIARRFDNQKSGHAIIVGSVAGDRGRQSNYAYGAAKAGLATYVTGLQHRFAVNKDINFTLIKPGFVDTPMTAHIEGKGALWAKPDQVADAIYQAGTAKKLTSYVPFFWWPIMTIIKSVPAFIFHKTKL